MMISTKGRYALRVMADLAEHGGSDYLPLKETAKRQEISLKYLESIMAALSKAGFVEAQHGKGGGYRLSRPACEYTAASILRLTEGTLAPVSCLSCRENPCKRAPECRILPVWTKLSVIIDDYLESVTLQDIIKSPAGDIL